jgi:hypothetical protein
MTAKAWRELDSSQRRVTDAVSGQRGIRTTGRPARISVALLSFRAARGRLYHSTKRSAAFPCCARRRARSTPSGAPSTTLHSPLIITRSAAWAPQRTSAAKRIASDGKAQLIKLIECHVGWLTGSNRANVVALEAARRALRCPTECITLIREPGLYDSPLEGAGAGIPQRGACSSGIHCRAPRRRGTEGSNPCSSSGESGANPSFRGGSHRLVNE